MPRSSPSSSWKPPLVQVDLSALDRNEHREIKYWKPETVGELLFNFWD
jgi:hypothetical protein